VRQLPFEYAFRNLGRSRVRLIASLAGSALVVLLVLAAAGFVRGMQLTLTQHDALNENVIILGAGSEEMVERSQIDAGVAGIATASIPGIRSEAGVAFVSPEIHMALLVRESADSADGLQAVLRGVRPVALLVHPEVEIVEGRPPEAGREETRRAPGRPARTPRGRDRRRPPAGGRAGGDHGGGAGGDPPWRAG
jgi:hypothetical protein